MKSDNIQIEVLVDGTIRMTTDPISGANHSNAEAFLRNIATMAGGKSTTVHRGSATKVANKTSEQEREGQ